MKKILVVFGTRPEALKLSPIFHHWVANDKYRKNISFETWFTSQSEEQYIKLGWNYSAKVYCGTVGPMAFGQIYTDLEWFIKSKHASLVRGEGIRTNTYWDAIMVQGDTFSTLAGAMVGFFYKIPVIHIEAGLRTYTSNPWPEEQNRIIVDSLSSFCFCPTERAYANVYRGDVQAGNETFTVGNTIIDQIKIEEKKRLPEVNWNKSDKPYFLCSFHRRESWNQFGRIASHFAELTCLMEDYDFIIPQHPNCKFNEAISSHAFTNNVLPQDAQDHASCLSLIKNSAGVITDSGGMIEEAAYFKKPCFIVRDETERQESVEVGLAKLVGRDKGILDIAGYMNNLKEWFRPEAPCPYGDGTASKKILDILCREVI